MTRLPFRIKRKDGAKLTDQVAAGLRHAIRSGAFHAGDSLPTCKHMATQAGVSEIIIRHAVKRLADEGLVRVRTRTGVKVSDIRGHVLGLQWGAPSMYYHSVLSGTVTERLEAANVLFDGTYIGFGEESKGFPKVQAHLAHAISLAVVSGSADGIDALLARRGIPFIHYTSSRPSPRAVRAIQVRHAAVFPAVRDHCLACGVRKALLVHLQKGTQNAELRKLLTDAGVRCRALGVHEIVGLENPECVERGAFNAMDIWLKRGRQLPDLIWFSDDFVARGALTAMTTRGVRVPQDVQVITWANRGFSPVCAKLLTRVEMDPIRDGEAVAACVLEQLDGKHQGRKPIVLTPVFIEGATTVKKMRHVQPHRA